MNKSYSIEKFGKSIFSMVPKWIDKIVIINDELIIHSDPKHVKNLIFFLKNHTSSQFNQLVDIVGVDYPERKNRFEVVYNLLSMNYNSRIKVKTFTDEITPIDSVVDIFRAAGWYEREVWDMYGVYFIGNNDLRRILTDYGFEGHPLRKDFPLTGYTEVRYDEEHKRVVHEPVEMTQEFRNFDFVTPWESIKNE